MSVYANIRASLELQIANVPGIPGPSNRAWQNVRFAPSTGHSWVRMTFQPSRRRPLDVTAGGTQRIDGVFLIDVFTPEGSGPSLAEDLADNVVTTFEAGTVLGSGSVQTQIEYAEISRAANQDSPWFQIPVTVKWKSFN